MTSKDSDQVAGRLLNHCKLSGVFCPVKDFSAENTAWTNTTVIF